MQPGLCLFRSQTPEDRFSQAKAHIITFQHSWAVFVSEYSVHFEAESMSLSLEVISTFLPPMQCLPIAIFKLYHNGS